MPRGKRRFSMGPARGSRATLLRKMSQSAAGTGLNAAGAMPRKHTGYWRLSRWVGISCAFWAAKAACRTAATHHGNSIADQMHTGASPLDQQLTCTHRPAVRSSFEPAWQQLDSSYQQKEGPPGQSHLKGYGAQLQARACRVGWLGKTHLQALHDALLSPPERWRLSCRRTTALSQPACSRSPSGTAAAGRQW